MLNVILIDDEPLARELLREYLRDFPELKIVWECGDGFEGVKAIDQHKPDLVFLDIQMPKINGFEMLELIDPVPAVIFTTAFDDYVKVFTADDMFLKKQTMSYYEETLPASEFIRVHRSFIIRIDQLTRIEPFEKSGHLALLKNGTKIPLSRTGYSRLREKLGL
jgi:two-component system LytT family response regulator